MSLSLLLHFQNSFVGRSVRIGLAIKRIESMTSRTIRGLQSSIGTNCKIAKCQHRWFFLWKIISTCQILMSIPVKLETKHQTKRQAGTTIFNCVTQLTFVNKFLLNFHWKTVDICSQSFLIAESLSNFAMKIFEESNSIYKSFRFLCKWIICKGK